LQHGGGAVENRRTLAGAGFVPTAESGLSARHRLLDLFVAGFDHVADDLTLIGRRTHWSPFTGQQFATDDRCREV